MWGKTKFECFHCHKHFMYFSDMNRHLRQFCEQGKDDDEKKQKENVI